MVSDELRRFLDKRIAARQGIGVSSGEYKAAASSFTVADMAPGEPYEDTFDFDLAFIDALVDPILGGRRTSTPRMSIRIRIPGFTRMRKYLRRSNRLGEMNKIIDRVLYEHAEMTRDYIQGTIMRGEVQGPPTSPLTRKIQMARRYVNRTAKTATPNHAQIYGAYTRHPLYRTGKFARSWIIRRRHSVTQGSHRIDVLLDPRRKSDSGIPFSQLYQILTRGAKITYPTQRGGRTRHMNRAVRYQRLLMAAQMTTFFNRAMAFKPMRGITIPPRRIIDPKRIREMVKISGDAIGEEIKQHLYDQGLPVRLHPRGTASHRIVRRPGPRPIVEKS